MSNARTKGEAPPEQPRRQRLVTDLLGYGLGALLGLAILWGVGRLAMRPAGAYVQELPHLAILAEFSDLADPGVRQDLCRLHRDLVQLGGLGLTVSGPLNHPVLLPGARPGDMPRAKDLDQLTLEEFQLARPFFRTGSWLTPRLYAPDGKSAVIRVGPPGNSPFPPGTARAVEDLLASYRGSALALSAYSRALGREDDEARARINLTFGVQTANVHLLAPGGTLHTMEAMLQLLDHRKPLAQHPRIRSITTPANWHHYAYGVTMHQADPDISQADGKQFEDFDRLGRLAKLDALMRADGSQGMVEVTTVAEGEENLELCFHVAGNIKAPNVEPKVVRKPPERR